MGRIVDITCKYYLVKTYTESKSEPDGLYDLRKWFEVILPLSLEARIKSFGNSGRGRLEEIQGESPLYALNFVRMESYSSTYTVLENECARHVDISVDEGEYIGKSTVALYDADKSILMLMGNQGGFSAHSATTYINSFFEKPVCVLEPIKNRKDFQKASNKYGKIKITISSVADYIPRQNAVYEDILNQAKEMSASTMSFEFSVGKKKNAYLDANLVRTIISDAYSNMGAVSVARVKMEDEEGTAVYNLFENVKHCVLRMETDHNGELAFEDIAHKMLSEYKK